MKKFLYLLKGSQYYPHEINVMSCVSGWKVLDKNSLFVLAFAKTGQSDSQVTYISELDRIASEAKKTITENL